MLFGRRARSKNFGISGGGHAERADAGTDDRTEFTSKRRHAGLSGMASRIAMAAISCRIPGSRGRRAGTSLATNRGALDPSPCPMREQTLRQRVDGRLDAIDGPSLPVAGREPSVCVTLGPVRGTNVQTPIADSHGKPSSAVKGHRPRRHQGPLPGGLTWNRSSARAWLSDPP